MLRRRKILTKKIGVNEVQLRWLSQKPASENL